MGADAPEAVIGNVIGAAATLHGALGRAAAPGHAGGRVASLHGARGSAAPAQV